MPQAPQEISGQALAAMANQGLRWLFDCAAPQWRGAQRCGNFLFPERFSVDGQADACPRRLFVQARHIYSFCEIGRLGWTGPWRPMVEASADFLLANGRRPDGFFIHRFDAHGAPLDFRADLYDQAFMLLALAHAGKAAGRPDYFRAAESLDETLQAKWRLPLGNYYEGDIAACPPYRQNPHMHLLEGFIALHAATGAERWLDRAEEIFRLCQLSFIDPASGALREYFDASLQPQVGVEGLIVEPGHCFEWSWLMELLARTGLEAALSLSDRLVGFARCHGLDAFRDVAINEVLIDGGQRDGFARLWPQTERLKAAAARFCRTNDPVESLEAQKAFASLTRYFDVPKAGLWRDKLLLDGSWIDEPAPGSSLYHITCAIAEVVDAVQIKPRRLSG